jgi:hypothetical protein
MTTLYEKIQKNTTDIPDDLSADHITLYNKLAEIICASIRNLKEGQNIVETKYEYGEFSSINFIIMFDKIKYELIRAFLKNGFKIKIYDTTLTRMNKNPLFTIKITCEFAAVSNDKYIHEWL